MCETLWCHTDQLGAATVWAALIAFAGVVLLFGGAWLVGQRQLKILEEQAITQGEQAKIQADQVALQKTALDIEHLKVRVELFERRMAVYQAARNWLDFVYIHDRTPLSLVADEKITDEQRDAEILVARGFLSATDQAQFLFSPPVVQALNAVWRDGKQHARLLRRQANKNRNVDPEQIQKDLDETFDRIIEVDAKLIDIFGEEIRLTLATTA